MEIADLSSADNRSTADCWKHFENHRQRVGKVLSEELGRQPTVGSLSVIGAGNVNDVDLVDLLSRTAEIRLVDWDADAVLSGVRRQLSSSASDRIRLFTSEDVTGVGHLLPPGFHQGKTDGAR